MRLLGILLALAFPLSAVQLLAPTGQPFRAIVKANGDARAVDLAAREMQAWLNRSSAPDWKSFRTATKRPSSAWAVRPDSVTSCLVNQPMPSACELRKAATCSLLAWTTTESLNSG